MIIFRCYRNYETNIAQQVCKFAVVAAMDNPHATAFRGYSSRGSAMRALKKLRADHKISPMDWAEVRRRLGIH